MREGEERIVLYERDEMLKHIEALQQENEQLRAQVARMSEILSAAHIFIHMNAKASGVNPDDLLLPKQIEEALEGAPDYHNPADVEALKQAMEALELILKKHTDIPNHNTYPSSTSICRKAIAAIDKIGGQE